MAVHEPSPKRRHAAAEADFKAYICPHAFSPTKRRISSCRYYLTLPFRILLFLSLVWSFYEDSLDYTAIAICERRAGVEITSPDDPNAYVQARCLTHRSTSRA